MTPTISHVPDQAGRRAEILSAAPVPFDDQGQIAAPTYEAMLRRIEPHVDGVFVAGTTGEFPALTADERDRLLAISVEVFGAERVVAHIGAPSLHEILPLADASLARGVTRLACITPYYLPCDGPDIRQHFAAIAHHIAGRGGELFVYLFPERSGLQVSPEELGELTRIEGIAGAKLSGAPNARFAEYVAACAPGSRVYSGDDSSLPAVMAAGGSGVVSGVSSAFPERFAALREALAAGEGTEGAQHSVLEAVSLIGPTITRLKYALSSANPVEGWTSRMTLASLDEQTAVQIRELVAR